MHRVRIRALVLGGLRWAPRLGLAFLGVGLLGWFVLVASFDSLVKKSVNRFNHGLKVKVEMGSAALRWKDIHFSKLRLLGPDGKLLLSAEEGTCDWRLWAGVRGGGWLWVGDATLEKVDAYFAHDQKGNFNWAGLTGPPGSGPPTIWTRYRGRLTAREGILHYKDERDGGFLYSIDGVTGQVEIAPGESVRVQGQCDNPTLPWHGSPQRASKAQLKGHFSPLQPKLDATVTASDWPLEELARHPLIGNYVAVRGGTGSGRLWLHGEAGSWSQLWRRRVCEVRMQMGGAQVELPYFPEKFNQVQGELRWCAGSLETPGLKAQYLGGRTSMRGRMSFGSEGVDTRLMLQGHSLDLGRLASLVKRQLRPLAGKIDTDLSVEGFLRSPSVTGTVRSPRVVLAGRELRPVSVNFQWSAGGLQITDLSVGNGGGKFSADGWVFPGKLGRQGPDLKNVQVMLNFRADNARVQEFFPGIPGLVRADGSLCVVGSPLDPLVAGRATVRGMASMGAPLDGGEGSVLFDRAGAILYNANVISPLGGLNLPWMFYDFREKYAEGAVVTEGLSLTGPIPGDGAKPGESKLRGQLSATMTVRGRLDDPSSWVAAGLLHDGRADLHGQEFRHLNGPFLYKGGNLSSSNMRTNWGGGQLSLVGEWDIARRQVSGMLRGEGVSLGARVAGLTAPADFIAALNSQGSRFTTRGWWHSPEVTASALAFGDSFTSLQSMVWFDGVDPRRLGMSAAAGEVRGQAAVEVQGGRQKVYYDATAGGNAKSDKDLRIVGEATRTAEGWRPGSTWLSFPGPGLVLSRNSPTMWEGGAYPYHGPDTGRPLRRVPLIGGFPQRGGGKEREEVRGLLSLRPSGVDNYAFWSEGLDMVSLCRLSGFDPRAQLERWADLDLVSAPFSAQGSVRLPAHWGDLPEVKVSLQAPWLQVVPKSFWPGSTRPTRRPSGSVAFAASASLTTGADGSVRGEARLNPKPYAPPGSPGELKVAGRFYIPRTQGIDLRIDTNGLALDTMRPLLRRSWRAWVPSGRLDAKDLRVWGELRRLNLAGSLALHSGRIWLHQQAVDVDEARLKLSSSGGEVRIDEMTLEAGPLRLEGEGRRGRDDRLSGMVRLKQTPLSFLRPLGRPWSELDGPVEAQVAFQGTGLVPQEFFGSLRGSRLTYKPVNRPSLPRGAAIQPLVIEELLLGKAPTPQEGVRLRFAPGELIVDIPEDCASATLLSQTPGQPDLGGKLSVAGQFRLTALPGKNFADWLVSPRGPRFGDGKHPWTLAWQNLSWPLLARYLTWSSGIQGDSSGRLQLAGQFHQAHELNRTPAPRAGEPQILAQVTLDRLHLSRGQAKDAQVLNLLDPLQARYQRGGDETWLHVEPFRLQLDQSASGKNRAGELRGEAHIPVTRASSGKVRKAGGGASLHLSAQEMPLDMLAAFFPFLAHGNGTIHDLSVDGAGDQLRAQIHLGSGSLAGVQFAKLDGSLTGKMEESPGGSLRYRVDLNHPPQKNEAGLMLYLGPQVSASHRLFLDGGASLLWERPAQHGLTDSKVLQPLWAEYRLSNRSALDLHADLVDEEAGLLASLIPQSKTSGRLGGSLDIKGSLAEPLLAGSLAWDNGSLTHPWLGSPLTDIQVMTRFERITAEQAEPSSIGLLPPAVPGEGAMLSRYTLEKLDGIWDTRPFQGRGKVELLGLQPTFLKVGLSGKDLPLTFGDYFRGRGDVDLNLLGRLGRDEVSHELRLTPLLTGQVDIPSGDLRIPVSAVTLGSEWASFWKNSPVRYDLDLTLGDNVWVNFLSSSVRAQGGVKIVPAVATGAPVLAGEMFLSRGIIRIPLYEVNFRVRQGYAYFEDALLPRLENVEADTTLGGYQITARFDGLYPDLHADLVSNPPMADTELKRLVGFDGSPQAGSSGPALDVLNQNNAFLSSQGITFLSNMLTGQFVQGIGRALFLSEVSFDFLPPSDYQIKVAKALDAHEKLLVIFSQIISSSRFTQSSQQFGVEWRFQPNLLTRVSIDNLGQARLWFQGVLRF